MKLGGCPSPYWIDPDGKPWIKNQAVKPLEITVLIFCFCQNLPICKKSFKVPVRLQSSPFDPCDRTRTRQHTRHFNSTRHFSLWHLLSGKLKENERINKMRERSKTLNWIFDHFSLAFINFLLPWMLYFHVRLQNKGKVLSLEWIL